ncbi:MAG: T9SS type A sorting domain-containing protein [Chitinophagales bacterium]
MGLIDDGFIDYYYQQLNGYTIPVNGSAIRNSGTIGPTEVLTIPVCFHVVSPVGAPDIVSYADLTAAIDQLNANFRGVNCSGQLNGRDIQVQFCLAQRSILNQGFPPLSSGIYQIPYSRTNNPGVTWHNSPYSNFDYQNSTSQINLKTINGTLTNFPHQSYLNIYIVTSCDPSGTVAAYGMFPGYHGQDKDGVVITSSQFGNCDIMKVLTHEVGHYLGLYHTFNQHVGDATCQNSDCLVNGDRMCDTRPHLLSGLPVSGCISNSCTTDNIPRILNGINVNPFTTDGNDPAENYMNYSNKACQYSFTDQQRLKMRYSLITERNSLLDSKGCQLPCGLPVSAVFNTTTVNINSGNTSITATSVINSTTCQWKILKQGDDPLNRVTTAGSISGGVATLNYTFPSVGNYIITLVLSPGSECQEVYENIVTVTCPNAASFSSTPASLNIFGTLPQTVVLNNTSIVAGITYNWSVDGTAQTYSNPFNFVVSNPGGYRLCLTASNALCATSTCRFYRVNLNCESPRALEWWHFGDGYEMHFDNISGLPLANTNVNGLRSLEGTSDYSNDYGSLVFCTNANEFLTGTPATTVLSNSPGNYCITNSSCKVNTNTSGTTSSMIFPYPSTAASNNSNKFVCPVISNHEDGSSLPSNADNMNELLIRTITQGSPTSITYTGVIDASVSEQLAVSQKCNGAVNNSEYWIIVHGLNNLYRAYPFTASGVGTPVVSSVGGNISGSAHAGIMKFSLSGRRLARAYYDSPGYIEILNFDPSTGVFSGPLVTYAVDRPYGLEFSPDEQFIYFSQYGGGDYGLFQASANAVSTPLLIANSTVERNGFGQLQLASDGKIYISTNNGYLSSIDKPNVLAVSPTSCGYNTYSINFQSGSTHIGLPNFNSAAVLAAQANQINGPAQVCQGSASQTYSTPNVCGSTFVWSLVGAPAGVSLSTTTGSQVQITFGTATGSFNLKLKVTRPCGSMEYLKQITILPNASALTVKALIQAPSCNGTTATISTSTGYASYQWSPSGICGVNCSNSIIVSPTVTTTYSVTATSYSGCSVTGSKTLTVPPVKSVSISPANPTLCFGSNVTLTAVPSTTGATYQWSTNAGSATTASVTVSTVSPPVYSVTALFSGGCTATASVNVNAPFTPNLTTYPNSICGTAITFPTLTASVSGGGTPPFTYRWNSSAYSSVNTFTPTSFNLQNLYVKDANGCVVKFPFQITQKATPAITMPPIIASSCSTGVVTMGGTPTAVAGPNSSSYTYNWSPSSGLTGPTTSAPTRSGTVPAPVAYGLTVTDPVSGCTASGNQTIQSSDYGFLEVLDGKNAAPPCAGRVVSDLQVGSDGSVYATGWFHMDMNFQNDGYAGVQNFTDINGGTYFFVAKYDGCNAPAYQWQFVSKKTECVSSFFNSDGSCKHPFSPNLALSGSVLYMGTTNGSTGSKIVRVNVLTGASLFETSLSGIAITDIESDGAGFYVTGFATTATTLGTTSLAANELFVASINTNSTTSLAFNWVQKMMNGSTPLQYGTGAANGGYPCIALDNGGGVNYLVLSTGRFLQAYSVTTSAATAIGSLFNSGLSPWKANRIASSLANGKVFLLNGSNLISYRFLTTGIFSLVSAPAVSIADLNYDLKIKGNDLYVINSYEMLRYAISSSLTQSPVASSAWPGGVADYMGVSPGFTNYNAIGAEDRCIGIDPNVATNGRIYFGGSMPLDVFLSLQSKYLNPTAAMPYGFIARVNNTNGAFFKTNYNSIENLMGEWQLFRVYPNPTDGRLSYTFTGKESSEVEVSLFNNLGQQLKQFTQQMVPQTVYSLDMLNLPEGQYQLRLANTTGSQRFPIIKYTP